jgi:hypothetical protein
MLLTILKIIAGIAVLGIVALVLLAVFGGLVAAIRAKRGTENDHGSS